MQWADPYLFSTRFSNLVPLKSLSGDLELDLDLFGEFDLDAYAELVTLGFTSGDLDLPLNFDLLKSEII